MAKDSSTQSQHTAAIALLKHGGDLLHCGKASEAAEVLDESLRLLSTLVESDDAFVAAVEKGRAGHLVDHEHVVSSIERIVGPLSS